MIATHILDNRPMITSLKFQAFVRFGLEPYDTAVEQFLKSRNSNTPNRVREVHLSTLLKYNGLDALMTYMLAKKQQGEMDGKVT